MAHTTEQRKVITEIARAKRRNPDADVTDLTRTLKTLTLEQRIREYVSAAPLPTPEQRDRLMSLLRVPEGVTTDG